MHNGNGYIATERTNYLTWMFLLDEKKDQTVKINGYCIRIGKELRSVYEIVRRADQSLAKRIVQRVTSVVRFLDFASHDIELFGSQVLEEITERISSPIIGEKHKVTIGIDATINKNRCVVMCAIRFSGPMYVTGNWSGPVSIPIDDDFDSAFHQWIESAVEKLKHPRKYQ